MRYVTASVIISARDAARTIGETLDSIAAQTAAPLEIILVDDGSIDETADIAERHPARVHVVRSVNRGPAAAANTGVGLSRGKWLAFLDADDLWMPERLRLALDKAHSSGCDAVMGSMLAFRDPDTPPEAFAGLRYVEGVTQGAVVGALLVRSSGFRSLGGFDERFRTGHFVEFMGRFRHAGQRLETIPDCILLRRIRPASLGRRSASDATGGTDRLSKDFLQIAREAIRRRAAGN